MLPNSAALFQPICPIIPLTNGDENKETESIPLRFDGENLLQLVLDVAASVSKFGKIDSFEVKFPSTGGPEIGIEKQPSFLIRTASQERDRPRERFAFRFREDSGGPQSISVSHGEFTKNTTPENIDGTVDELRALEKNRGDSKTDYCRR